MSIRRRFSTQNFLHSIYIVSKIDTNFYLKIHLYTRLFLYTKNLKISRKRGFIPRSIHSRRCAPPISISHQTITRLQYSCSHCIIPSLRKKKKKKTRIFKRSKKQKTQVTRRTAIRSMQPPATIFYAG